MKNKINITSDGINAYALLNVKASKLGTQILSGLLILEIIGIIILFSIMPLEDLTSMIIPFLIIIFFLVVLPIKYLLWNLYGNEELIVNSKSISWSYDYGFYKTNLETITFNRLGTGFEKIKNSKGNNELGRLVFFNYREDNNLPELIHHTTILLTKKEVDEFNKKILNVFTNDFLDEKGFIPFSDN